MGGWEETWGEEPSRGARVEKRAKENGKPLPNQEGGLWGAHPVPRAGGGRAAARDLRRETQRGELVAGRAVEGLGGGDCWWRDSTGPQTLRKG